jgi:hypothetical protein
MQHSDRSGYGPADSLPTGVVAVSAKSRWIFPTLPSMGTGTTSGNLCSAGARSVENLSGM